MVQEFVCADLLLSGEDLTLFPAAVGIGSHECPSGRGQRCRAWVLEVITNIFFPLLAFLKFISVSNFLLHLKFS